MPYTIPTDAVVSLAPGHDTAHDNIADILTPNAYWNVLNTAFAGGADPAGAADSTAAFNAALAAAPPGQPVVVPAGVYKTSAPVIIPPGGGLAGPGAGSFAYYGGSLVMPLVGAVITPSASFAPATYDSQAVQGVITLLSKNLGGYSGNNGNTVLRGITIDGRSAPSGTNGIEAWGPVWALRIEDCGIYGLPQYGVYTNVSSHDGTGKAPDLWLINRLHIAACGSDGFCAVSGLSDAYITNSESTGNTGTGWNMTGDNARMAQCKAEFNHAYGFRVISGGSGGAGGGNNGFWLNGCSTDHNYEDGCLVYGSGNGPVTLDGCNFHGDGYNAGSGGGGYAGIRLTGAGYVYCTGQRVLSASGATPFPQYGIRNDGGGPVVVSGSSIIYGNTAATDNTAGGSITLGSNVTSGTGAWGT